jgi:DNA-binding SARP family transcriptional activator
MLRDFAVVHSFEAPLDSVEDVLAILESSSDDPWVHYGLGLLWSARRKNELAFVTLERAARGFEEALASGSDEARQGLHLVQVARGMLADREGQDADARASFADASRLAGFTQDCEFDEDEQRWVMFDRSGMITYWLQCKRASRRAGQARPLGCAYYNLGIRLLERGEPLPSRRFLERALELRPRRAAPLAHAETLNGLARAEWQLGLTERAAHHIEAAIAIAQAQSHEALLSDALINLAEARCNEGGFDESEVLYGRSVAMSQRTEDVRGLARSYALNAELCLLRGEPQRAASLADRAVSLRVPSGDPAESAQLLSTHWRARLAAGDAPGLVASRLEEVVTVLADHDAKGDLAVAIWWLAASRLRSGDEGQVSDAVTQVLEIVGRNRLEHFFAGHAAMHPRLVEIALGDPELGDVARSLEVLARRASARPVAGSAVPQQPRMRIRLFGEFSFHLGNKEVPVWTWRSKKAASLLAFLAHHRGDPVHREQAMEALWPAGDPERARKNLNVALTAMRRGLEKVDPDGAACIRREGAFYRLDPDLIEEIDAVEFLRSCDEAATFEFAGDFDDALAAADRALELAEGEYLASELYADWVTTERTHLRERRVDLLLRTCEWQLDLDRPADAIRRARHVLEMDEIRERAWYALMRAHIAAGDRAAALQAFEECSQLLQRELNVTPGRELADLARRARDGE